jgi:hypothetical protein
MFGDMLNETLTLRKTTTGHIHNFRANVQPSRSLVFTDDARLPVEDGDTIERPRPNCVELYTVVDAGYHESVNGIPAHFQMKVRKITKLPEASQPKAQIAPASSDRTRGDGRRTRLTKLLDDLEQLHLCGPSDDPDEQTSVIESYRYLLINLKALSKGLMPSDVMEQLDGVPSKIETIYDVYESKAHLDAVSIDLRTELEFPTTAVSTATPSFVSPFLVEELRLAKNHSFDVTKLTGYCTEINSSFHHGNVVACLLLMRTVMNHVPPVFGFTTFTELTASSGKSLRENLEHLEKGLRKLADLYAHQPIRTQEQYPTKSQVEPFRGHFELLLQEVLNKLR